MVRGVTAVKLCRVGVQLQTTPHEFRRFHKRRGIVLRNDILDSLRYWRQVRKVDAHCAAQYAEARRLAMLPVVSRLRQAEMLAWAARCVSAVKP